MIEAQTIKQLIKNERELAYALSPNSATVLVLDNLLLQIERLEDYEAEAMGQAFSDSDHSVFSNTPDL